MFKKIIILLTCIVNCLSAMDVQKSIPYEALKNWHTDHISKLSSTSRAKVAKIINDCCSELMIEFQQLKAKNVSEKELEQFFNPENLKVRFYLTALAQEVRNYSKTEIEIDNALTTLRTIKEDCIKEVLAKLDKSEKRIIELKNTLEYWRLEHKRRAESGNGGCYICLVRISETNSQLSKFESYRKANLFEIYSRSLSVYLSAYKLCKTEGELLSLL